jgi:uncharacterized protein YxeA
MIKRILIGIFCLFVAGFLFVLIFNNTEVESPVIYVQQEQRYDQDLFSGLKSHLDNDSLYIFKMGKENPFK